MKSQNPFLYSADNKRYHTWNYYLKHRFQQKVFKVALNANFSCPNRDGRVGIGGCSFCTSLGSGEQAGDVHQDLQTQYHEGIQMMKMKWPNGMPMPYFQAFSNTYAPLSVLKKTFDPFLQDNDIKVINIATRADCLSQEIVDYFQSYASKDKEIWIELGLQSMHDETAKRINRGHTYQQFLDGIQLLKKSNLKICVHIINSLPYETKEMMLSTTKALALLPIHAIKIHMLHIMKDTALAKTYEESPFPMLSMDEYIDLVISQLEVLPPEMIIQRLTGDGVKEQLIAPLWTTNKISVLNGIDKEMVKRNSYQGKKFR